MRERQYPRGNRTIVLCQIVVRNPQHGQPASPHISVPAAIVFHARRVRLAVQFDDQLRGLAEEVGKIRPYRLLAAEFEPAQSPSAQQVPQNPLSRGG